MNLFLNNKVALVCASSEGIGRAIAKGLAIEGANVALFSRDINKLEVAAKEIRTFSKGKITVHAGDISKPRDINRIFNDVLIQHGGRIDILINNQGGPAAGGVLDLAEDDLDNAYQANLRSVFLITKLCLLGMRERKWGRIINILSISGKEPLPNMLLSNIFRPAVLGFAKTIANENAPYNITINSLLPAAVMTNRTISSLMKAAETKGVNLDELIFESEKKIPIGRIAEPDEFSQMALFLCGENASYITGTAISVDGGVSRALW